MLPSLLLLVFGVLQNYIGRREAIWPWALSYGLSLGLIDFVVVGGNVSPIMAITFGFYCWGYLFLLRRWDAYLAKWLLIYWLGALLPLGLVLLIFL